MYRGRRVSVIIPALNEAEAIGRVLGDIPDWVDQVIVGDNGSSDNTAAIAAAQGATIAHEPRQGYGSACLAAMARLDHPDIVVFLDADYSDDPREMGSLVDPIVDDGRDLVIGSRVLGEAAAGSLTTTQRFGNWLSCRLIRLIWGVRFTDLGPFRAIRADALRSLEMCDRDYGWTVEMQVKAAERGLRVAEVPVSYRRRIGRSKVSGTMRGVWGAGTKILYTIFAAALRRRGVAAERHTSATRAGRDPARGAAPLPYKLVVFTRYPVAGAAKTRMIPAIGAEAAANLHYELAAHTLRTARAVVADGDIAVEVHFAGGNTDAMRTAFGTDLAYVPQAEGDLGQRMAATFEAGISVGVRGLVIIGTDCPALTPEHLREAFAALAANDVVFGPAADGGYYLVGLRRSSPELFEGIGWGGETVLAASLQRAGRLGLSYRLLDELRDVDRPEDLEHWHSIRTSMGTP